MSILEHRPPDFGYFPEDEPLIFLGGPIQGAPNWQGKAINELGLLYAGSKVLNLANPRRDSSANFNYLEQVRWEKRYLERARDYGAILFWLAVKDGSIPYEKGRAYAQTTRFEVGRAFGWRDYDPSVNILIGIEPGYIGSERYIKTLAAEYDMSIYKNLGSLCIEAADTINRLQ